MTHELLLLRHGQVASHRGDVPVTPEGLEFARGVGESLGAAYGASGQIRLINGGTRRTRETAEAVETGLARTDARVVNDGEAFALRNPDLYLAGVRVNMVSSEEDFATQVPDFSAAQVDASDFYREWLTQPDRVGWWVAHATPPGDTAADVARRIERFAGSLLDRDAGSSVTVGVTHSPVLRACAVHVTGSDPGEPTWLAGIRVIVADDRSIAFELLDVAP